MAPLRFWEENKFSSQKTQLCHAPRVGILRSSHVARTWCSYPGSGGIFGGGTLPGWDEKGAVEPVPGQIRSGEEIKDVGAADLQPASSQKRAV